ncbi:MAG: hypothetical protein MAG451_00889 [Anaerolineales bacterium]|nr:hypothetical protein [Anaerolineales bacterium]
MCLRGTIALLIILIVMACQPIPTAPPVQPAAGTTTTATPPLPAGALESAEEQMPMTEDTLDLDEANVTFVKATEAGDGTWRFDVTVRHNDEGWDHYANGWDIVLPDGTVLKRNPDDEFTRLLLHPHENEQPFTRSQSGLTIPEGVSEVTVRAHCIVHEFGGRDVVVDLTAEEGPHFKIERRP